jgi:hypothetical protein
VSRGFKIAIGIVFGILILIGIPEIGHLLIGWVSFIGKVVPRIEVNWSGVALLVLCLALTAGVGHSFCRWLWRGTGHEQPWKPRWTFSGIGVVVLMFSGGMAFTGIAHQTAWLMNGPPLYESSSRAAMERNASTSLRTIWSAQMEFRRKDPKLQAFWKKDIAGLYAAKADGQPMKLIELSIAAADVDPQSDIETFAVRGAKAGHWFRALPHADEKTPDPQRFAACAFPTNPRSGKYAFIISEKNVVYRKGCPDGIPPAAFPAEPEKEGWAKLD